MINDQLSPEERAIIDQIQAVPKLELGTAARERIRGRMLDEFRVVSQQSAVNAVTQTRLAVLTVTGLIVITFIVIIVLAIIANQNRESQTPPATSITLSASPQITATTPTLTDSPPTITPQGNLGLTPMTQPTVAASTPTRTFTPSLTLSTPTSEATNAALSTPVLTITASMTTSATETALPATQSATPEAASSPSATTAPTLDTVIVIEGPVINIVNNIITIYDFEIEVEVNHPILNLIEIGDVVHVEGAYGSTGVVVATIVSNLSSTPLVSGATVSLDGPVESINGNIIVVNSIPVQLAATDPLLQTVQVGQFVSVQGNFQGSGSNIVLVVVTIVVNTNVTVTDTDCWYHDDGMGMGHWHCDGMGMGIGMGDDGMGMGMEGG